MRGGEGMAYTCVLAPSLECDGCGECECEHGERPDARWDLETDYDDKYCDYCEREE